MTHDIKALLSKLSSKSTDYLHNAAGLCVSRTNYEIGFEHFLVKALEDSSGEIIKILNEFNIETSELRTRLNHTLEDFKTGNTGNPVFSPFLIELFENSWMHASIDFSLNKITSGIVLYSFIQKPSFFGAGLYIDNLKKINSKTLKDNFFKILSDSTESEIFQLQSQKKSSPPSNNDFISQYCQDFTKKAYEGKIDPVFGREDEIQQIIDVLARRRKNNPILVGEPGVGKTAVIEGLALRIIENDIPEMLSKVMLLGLDMGALEAGAGVKGEFENRLKGVLDEIKASEKPIILFIDEAHTLIGAGGSAGTSDAANLLKPALARGEIKTCAATTWSEYKKYFEKDPALERRFQMIKLSEPNVEKTALILRGLKPSYEKVHNVIIRDDAIICAAEFADRYITSRFLPDKAIDLLDTGCARVKINLSSRPHILTILEKEIQALEREKSGMKRDMDNGLDIDQKRALEIDLTIESKKSEFDEINARYLNEKELANQVVESRNKFLASKNPNEKDQTRQHMKDKISQLKNFQGENPMVNIEVDPDVISKVVSDWTGIPLGKLQRDQASTVLNMEKHLSERVKGQDQGLSIISKVIKASKAGIKDPAQPMGIFLLAGPSGVGKTETGLSIADLLFGGETNTITINMSEFQERHTTSRLIGSPPGYVGYGEGGLLTEAVRQNPYCVVLLDEVEKAHPDVMNLFYQVFDKGVLTDGEGKEISFSNTVIILTSNLGTDIIAEMTSEEDEIDIESVTNAVRPLLSKHFKPALLARMTIVPYFTLNKEALKNIVELKLNKLKTNLLKNTKMVLEYDETVKELITARCSEVETGARNIDYILQSKVMPEISQTVLKALGEKGMPEKVIIKTDDQNNFQIEFLGIQK
ncbi:MAG: type VI secretion system ATPase TssH [Desulforegulaceae bacterium]|jgi:type VI secretion system protein VasG|nr:type VI secretion system ATPase TssH [Desulforegulaceae bacterium]